MNRPGLDRIVVGVDGSERARVALQWACELAERNQARVEVIRACAHPMRPLTSALRAMTIPVEEVLAEPTRQLEKTVRNTNARCQIEASTVLRSAEFALERASYTADLVVLGRTGRGKLKNLLIGSTTKYCAHRCSCAVAIIHDQQPVGRVTVAVDGSERSVAALAWALAVWPIDQIHVVYSHDSSVLDGLPVESIDRHDFEGRAQSVVAEALEEAARRAGVDPSAISSEMRAGDPRISIVDQMSDVDLLVLGTHGHSGIARWMLGSLADYAVQHAPGSILIWRSRDLP